MKRFSQQFNTAAKRVTMTKAESRELKDRLYTYMEYHPLPQSAKAGSEQLASEPFRVWQFGSLHLRAFVGMTAMIALIIVPFAAERAVPGDVLYPVKVRFNEEVRSSLALSPYQQVEWETQRVERRLAEARLLANEGKLTEAIEAEVAEAVKHHSDAAQAGLARLRETDSEEAAIAELSFASALEVESEVLETETERQQAAGASTTAQLAATIADVRANVAKPETTEVSFARLLARVEEETTRASETLLSLEGDISDEERTDIDRRLADINRKIQLALSSQSSASGEADEASETPEAATMVMTAPPASSSATTSTTTTTATSTPTGPEPVDEAMAKQYLREALRDSQKLLRFMTDIDVNSNVSVEELVPVTPTDEERRVRINQDVDLLRDRAQAIENQGALDAKITLGLKTARELVNKAASRVVINKFSAAETALQEAEALITDMEAVLNTPTAPEVPAPAATSSPATTTTSVETATTTSSATTSAATTTETNTDAEA